MGKIHGSTQLLLFTENPQLTQIIDTALVSEPGFNLIGSAKVTRSILETIQAAQPDIILLDSRFDSEESFQLVDEISSKYSLGVLVVILPEGQVNLSERVILAGARAFITAPFTQSALLNSRRRVRELLLRTGVVSPESGFRNINPARVTKRSFVVYSPKGGVGCTTFSINLGIALHQKLREKVLVVDGKRYLGHVSLMLNLRTGNSITDLIPHAQKLDDGLIRQVVVDHVSGISVLPSSPLISKGQNIRPEDLYKIILKLQNVYEYIVVDGGNYLDENLVTYMDTADYIVLIVTPNLASLKDAKQFLDMSPTLSYPKDKILLVLNQAGHKADVKLGDIEKSLHAKVIGTIPVDEEFALGCLNEGIPILQKKPNHAISKAVKNIAKLLSEMTVSVPDQAGGLKSSQEILRKSSYLG
jgi:pilus assembly protein CpaE